MMKNQFALAYASCTDAELRGFVADRGLAIDWTTRKAAIQALRNADKNATFRFLDLTPELRNLIYEYLLTFTLKGHGSHRQYCSPLILMASKQINTEGSGILYDNRHPIVINLAPSGWHQSISVWGGPYKHIKVSVNNRRCGVGPPWRLQEAPIDWKSFLLKVRKLQIVIRSGTHTPRATFQGDNIQVQVNQALYDLSQFLNSPANPCSTIITIKEKGSGDADFLLRALVPFALLRGVDKWESTGTPALAARIQNGIQALDIRPNHEDLLRKCRMIQDEVEGKFQRVMEANSKNAALMKELQVSARELSQAEYHVKSGATSGLESDRMSVRDST